MIPTSMHREELQHTTVIEFRLDDRLLVGCRRRVDFNELREFLSHQVFRWLEEDVPPEAEVVEITDIKELTR